MNPLVGDPFLTNQNLIEVYNHIFKLFKPGQAACRVISSESPEGKWLYQKTADRATGSAAMPNCTKHVLPPLVGSVR